MPSGNDANDIKVAQVNCAYCAVGGLVGKPASEIMQMVYNELGEPIPNGVNSDSSDGFARYYHKVFAKRDGSPPDEPGRRGPLPAHRTVTRPHAPLL